MYSVCFGFLPELLWDRVTVDKEWRKEIFENTDSYSISYLLKEIEC